MNLGDVVVVGAGPAGVRAAETLVQAGLRPVVIDEAPRAGGQIYRQPPAGFVRTKQQLYGFESRKADAIHRSFERLAGKIVHLPSTLVWNCDEHRLDLLTEGRHATRRFSHLILCTGATDRVLPFPGWLLPGVYTLGAAQVALKAQGCVLGGGVVLMGSGPLLYLLAYQYAKAGAQVAAVLETASFANQAGATIDLARQPLTFGKGVYFVAWLRSRGIRVSRGVHDVAVLGDARVQEVSWRIGDREHRIACDAVATGFNLRSETQLADLAGCEFDFDPVNRQWLPRRDAAGRSSVAGVYLAGDGVGILGADAAELAGRRAALALLEDVGEPTDDREPERLERALRRSAGFQRGLGRAFPLPVAWLRACPDDLVICRCENVRAGDLRQAASDGRATEINRLKALTRVGMGRCQGRMCAGARSGDPGLLHGSTRRGRRAPACPAAHQADLADADAGGSPTGAGATLTESSAPEVRREPLVDVAIIGGGLVGCAAALALHRRGRSVVLLEQGWCGAQASGVNHGGVRRQGRAAIQLPLAQRAHAVWRHLPEVIGDDCEFVMSGHLKLARTEADMAVLEADNARAAPFGLQLELLGREQLRRRYPALGDKLPGASFCVGDGHANPRLVAAGFALAARREGVRILEGETVASAALEGSHFVLRTRDGLEVRSRSLLNCAGAWGAAIAARFGEHVPEYSIHPNMLVTEPIAPLGLPNLGVVGGDIYARQVARGNVILGGGRGSGALQLDANRPDSGASFEAIRTACDVIPALAEALVIRSWTGVEGALPDGQPVIGPSLTTPGLWHAFGFCGAGFQLAPGVGEVLCDLVVDNATATPIEPFGIGRFGPPGAVPQFTAND